LNQFGRIVEYVFQVIVENLNFTGSSCFFSCGGVSGVVIFRDALVQPEQQSIRKMAIQKGKT
jgi:hypothetical protein